MAIVACDVILNTDACKSPPGIEGIGGVRATCFACGQHACTSCSTIRTYLGCGRKRICNDCIEQWGLDR